MGKPYLGELRIMSFNFPPKNWAPCNGQLMAISQNQALFALLGTAYGGNGTTTFALPDLRTRVPAHVGNGVVQGESYGEAFHTLTQQEIPQHVHLLNADVTAPAASNTSTPGAGASFGATVGDPSQGPNFPTSVYGAYANLAALAPGSLATYGGSQPHENRQPFLTLNICIALSGVFPSRN
ncbi:tail fiber protein [soil metagenome]